MVPKGASRYSTADQTCSRVLIDDKSDTLQAVITPAERPLHPNGNSTGVSLETHERPGQERLPIESDNSNSLALRPNGEERTSVERHPAENDHDPLQSGARYRIPRHLSAAEEPGMGTGRYASKKEHAQSAVEGNYAPGQEAAHRASEGVRDYPDRRAITVHEPSFFSQQELERIAASVRSIQREEAAARHPRAAQLPSVPGLAPDDNGVWPPRSLEPEYLMRSRDNLRGPRTTIKLIILIVSIFTVPIAYYFWMGGWDPIRTAQTEMASFALNSIMPPPMPASEDVLPPPRLSTGRGAKPAREAIIPPSSKEETTTARGGDLGTPAKGRSRTAKSFTGGSAILQPGTLGARDPLSSTAARALDLPKPSSQQETTISRDDDPRAPAKGELRTPKSSASETSAMLQAPTPLAQNPPLSPPVRPLDVEQTKLLMKQGEQFIAAGDVVTARIAFQRAAEAGDAKAAVALGATYDPTALAKLGVVGISADVAKARSWYQRAEKWGSPEASRRLEVLADR